MDLTLSYAVGPGEFGASLREMAALVMAGKSTGFHSTFRRLMERKDAAAVSKELGTHEADGFVNWDPHFLSMFYPGEEDRRLGPLPYSKLISWTQNKNLVIETSQEDFLLSSVSPEWDVAVRRGYEEISAKRLVYDDGHAIRLFAADDRSNTLKVQRAKYSQQAQSNLIADYAPPTAFPSDARSSLRQMLSREFRLVLPPLDDARLANTLGVSVLVMCHDNDGLLRPLVQLRAPASAAMANSGIHCTGSKAAKWPRGDQQFSAENFFDDEAYAAVERDFDLRRADGDVSLYPVALVREHARMGKPQLFYFGYTKRKIDDILRFRLEQQREREIQLSPKLEKYRKMTLDEFRKLILTDIWTDRERYKITHEAYAMLYLLLSEFGKR